MDPDKAIEHDRSQDASPRPAPVAAQPSAQQDTLPFTEQEDEEWKRMEERQ